MKEMFKATGCKVWGVMDNYFFYKNKEIPYFQLRNIHIINKPKGSLTNGVAQVEYAGNILTLGFKPEDKERAEKAIAFAKSKITGKPVKNCDVATYNFNTISNTAAYNLSMNQKTNKSIWKKAVIVFSIICFVIGIAISVLSDSGYNNATIECQVCHREFQKGSENAKSIRKTNMCTGCYRSFKGASDALQELPID